MVWQLSVYSPQTLEFLPDLKRFPLELAVRKVFGIRETTAFSGIPMSACQVCIPRKVDISASWHAAHTQDLCPSHRSMLVAKSISSPVNKKCLLVCEHARRKEWGHRHEIIARNIPAVQPLEISQNGRHESVKIQILFYISFFSYSLPGLKEDNR